MYNEIYSSIAKDRMEEMRKAAKQQRTAVMARNNKRKLNLSVKKPQIALFLRTRKAS
ncbi:hypothetical protein [Ornithinibacillus halophilus]|uniref:Uncharacterized protein n=1 Tax=Ornithinibacillus halophilus TaxID=930117 RepID=A0A1M5IHH7_9BACI|nr:hypothetical protein [Ornithinibacillus halophilus]SHG27696.1 hypothetical protein SAMN05216225_102416 [Ornithinibacillus halophilus]